MVKKLFVTIIYLFVLLQLFAQQKSNIAKKEVFTKGFPKSLLFRSTMGQDKDFESWEKAHLPYNAITKKYLNEEIPIDSALSAWANRYAKFHPEKLMLIHLNGESTSTEDKETHKTFFPGHWVYEAGTKLSENISEEIKVVKVDDVTVFSSSVHMYKAGDHKGEKLPLSVILVPVSANGEKNWYNSEFAIVEQIDTIKNSISLKRGQHFSTSKKFDRGTYIATIPADHWGGYLLWYYNLSTSCPRDSAGKNCADRNFDNLVNWFGKGGILENLDGIGYDIHYFEVSEKHHPKWDLDNNGVADRGVFNGKNLYRTGNWELIQKTRKHFGDNFIITGDGWNDDMQKAVGIMNGMESEGICKPWDAFREVSRTINQHTYWNLHNNARHKFSYIHFKLQNDEANIHRYSDLRRFGLGLATCLGVAYTAVTIPEMTGGELKKNNWLGSPASEIIYPSMKDPDLLRNDGIEMSANFINQFNFKEAHSEMINNELHIKGTDSVRYNTLAVKGPEVNITNGDLVVFLEVKAIDGLADFEITDRVPRKFYVKLEGLPGNKSEPQFGFLGTAGFTPLCFYFRNAGNSESPLQINFEVEEQGEIAIRNFTVHNSPLLMVREFEKGIVLVNASLDTTYVDLSKIFPTKLNLKQLQVDPAKIECYDERERDYHLHFNHGLPLENENKVEVPGLNALFLRR